MIVPKLSGSAFLEDVRSAAGGEDQLFVWWLGQSGFLVRWTDQFLLLDPYLSDSLTRKYQQTDKPHVRMSELVVDPSSLDFIDVVTSSHNHTDHLDGETLGPLLQGNPELTVIVPEANQQFAADRLQVAPGRLTTIDAGQERTCGPFRIAAIPAAHEELDRDENGCYRCLGYLVSAGRFTIYHSGDTLLYDGLHRWLSGHEIDLALLPINGRAPERRVAGNLNGVEAATLARDVGARAVVPCHYDMFEFNTASPAGFQESCRELKQPFRVVELGQRLKLEARRGQLVLSE